ncbi:MAG: hypothetical protein QN152_01255 [Armatimonadota bacterium]|nr:hypothetical protein [Armatimonadota bacterium]MDR7464063.1 hypothetical protein [Armatimonadota bacterium]MDR7468639.1 hypothetical protein [Armatimonadota bacterium]MDR7473762.1 hypothetical protein [Armatimonadota bacterium]MDR7538145.1 hypothetical protein [Armatimonadota bacterium]
MGSWGWVLAGACAVAVNGLARHLVLLLGRPYRPEMARPAGSVAQGVLYAFSWGMLPWAKESTRRHMLAYLRGVVFHLGIGAAFLALLVGPWRAQGAGPLRWALVTLSAGGAMAGLGGLLARVVETRLRRLSTPDDFFAVALVSLFTLAAAAAIVVPALVPAFYGLAAATLAYIPFGKIRHCFYFFFARYFFGAGFGRRGVLRWGKVHE